MKPAPSSHERSSAWTALALVLAIGALPAGFALADRVAPTPAQRRAAVAARRARAEGKGAPTSAADLLARASAAAARSRRAPKERAFALRRAALQLWNEVSKEGRPEEAAEALFRAAALRRAMGETEEALAGFLDAHARDPEGPFGRRATLAASVLLRGAGHREEALQLQETLAFPGSGSGRATGSKRARVNRNSALVDRARYERARTLQQSGRLVAARAAFRQLAEESEHLTIALSSFDGWACVLVEEEDFEGAAGVLEACRAKFRRRSFERTETGERVRRALLNLTCIPRLERAIAARQMRRATQD